MDIQAQLRDDKKRIDRALEAFLVDVEKETRTKDAFMADAVAYLAKTIRAGGKRIRPIMVCWGYRAMGGTQEDAIVRASISIELIHAFLLMHDDIIDRDHLRRGMPTVHAHYANHFRALFGAEQADHFGMAMGIVMGDFTYSLGNRALFMAQFSPDIVVRALQSLQDVVGLTVVGEMQDVRMGYTRDATVQDIMAMYENKTARYTFEGPLKLGSILAGADDAACAQWEKYAVPLGIAFQIRDDVLGIFGDEKKTGKPVGSDIAEGKMTLLVRVALDRATAAQRDQLTAILHKGDMLTADDITQYRTLLKETQACAYVQQRMDALIDDAHAALQDLPVAASAKVFLSGVADYVRMRDL